MPGRVSGSKTRQQRGSAVIFQLMISSGGCAGRRPFFMPKTELTEQRGKRGKTKGKQKQWLNYADENARPFRRDYARRIEKRIVKKREMPTKGESFWLLQQICFSITKMLYTTLSRLVHLIPQN